MRIVCILESRLDLSGKREGIGHVNIRFPLGHFLMELMPLSFNGFLYSVYSVANVTQWLTWS